jgi:hypothetical protein
VGAAVLTKLDAVNESLDAIGESPVSSLESGHPDATSAERILDRVSGRVQAKGWHVNRDLEVTLVRNTSNQIPVATDVLRIDTTGTDKSLNVVAKVDVNDDKTYLFDVAKRTFVFTKNVKVDITYELPFAELTPELQMYISALAAQEFQSISLGSLSLDALVAKRVSDAWAALQDAEAEAEDSNVITQSPHMAFTAFRRAAREI